MFETVFNCETKIFAGFPLPPIFNPKSSVGEIIYHSLTLNPDHIGQVSYENDTLTSSRELREQSIVCAENLRNKFGLETDDIISICSKNRSELASIVIGSIFNGNPIHTIDPSYKNSEIAFLLKTSKPKLIVCEESNVKFVKKAAEILEFPLKVISLDAKDNGLLDQIDTVNFRILDIHKRKSKLVGIISTSGLTGRPKCVGISHEKIIHQLTGNDLYGKTILSFSAINLYYAFQNLIFSAITNGKRIVTAQGFDQELFSKIVEKHEVDYLFVSPTQLKKLTQIGKSFESIRTVVTGGSYVNPIIFRFAKMTFPSAKFCYGYNLTEAGGGVAVTQNVHLKYTSGKLVPNVQIKIVDGEGNNLGIGESGEIYVKPEVEFKGYIENEACTQDALTHDSWIKTGDIGYFDEDLDFHVMDRDKNVIVYNNYLVSPIELEQFIGSIKGVKEVCVVGLLDTVYEQLPAAVIIKASDDDVTAKEIEEMVDENLSDYKKLRGGVHFVTSFPLTPSGDVNRQKLIQDILKNKK